MIAPRYLIWVTCLSFLPNHSDLGLGWVSAVGCEFCFLGANLHAIFGRCFIQALHQVYKFIFTAIYSINLVCKLKVCDVKTSDVDCTLATFKGFNHYMFYKDVEECWEKEATLTNPTDASIQSPIAP